MVQNILRNVATLSAQHYGATRTPDSAGEWPTLVRVVLEHGRQAKKDRDWSWVVETSLATAHDAAEQSAARLAEVLEAAGHAGTGHAGNKAGVLRALAEWWQRRIHEADGLAVFRTRSIEFWQQELRGIRGVSWELADRILLLVGGLSVYPLDRGSMRIAHRHGWMDAMAEYDDWQAFFGSAARDAEVDLRQLWQWNVQLGRDFCRRQPDCEHCPLQSLLPARGPVPLDGED